MSATQNVRSTTKPVAGRVPRSPAKAGGPEAIAEDLETAKGALRIWLQCLGDDFKVETMQPAMLAISGVLHLAWDADQEVGSDWLQAMSVVDLIRDALTAALNGGPKPIAKYLKATANLALELLESIELEVSHG